MKSKKKRIKKVKVVLFVAINILLIGAYLYINEIQPIKRGCLGCNTESKLLLNVSEKEYVEHEEPLDLDYLDEPYALSNIEEENKRLLIQKEINLLVKSNFKKPFNYRGVKRCKVTFLKGKHKVDNCQQDYVHKRAILNSLSNADIESIPSKFGINSADFYILLEV